MMIRVVGLGLAFHGKYIFEDVNLNINSQEKIGLIGRNGSGKSSFIKIILGQLEADNGKIVIPNYYQIGCLEQHLKFKHDSIIDEMASVLTEERAYELWKGEKILQGLGFSEDDMLSDPNTFSGGYQVKINLAKLLLLEPDLLLLDEPTNYLDIHSTKWLKSFLKKWPTELILITHDRAFMDSIITHTITIHRGLFRKTPGTTQKIKEQIAKEEELHEKARESQERKRKETQEWIDRFKSKASMASRAQSKVKALEKQKVYDKLTDVRNLEFQFNYLPYKSKKPLLTVENITFGYPDAEILIKDFSLEINAEDKICVIGKNGKGKSTLLKLISKAMPTTQGTIIQNDKVETGYFGQMNIDRLHGHNTVCEEIQAANQSASESDVRKVCSRVLFSGDDAKKKIAILSGGERSRVMLGKILIKQANLLFLDEPTNHLDMESADSLMLAIQQFQGAVVMVTHDELYLKKIANKLIIYDDGKVFMFNDSYDDFLRRVGWKDV